MMHGQKNKLKMCCLSHRSVMGFMPEDTT